MLAERPDLTQTSERPSSGHRVCIDALAARFGGTAYAVVALARELALRPEVASVTVVARRGSIVERGLASEQTIKSCALAAASRLELVRRISWEAVCLPRLASREDWDVVITMSGMLPRVRGFRTICLLFNPVMYERGGAANALRRRAVRRTARLADYVAAPSGYMANLVSASTGRECAVLPLGVDHSVFVPAGDPGRDVLCVADFYAHKRHDLLLDAWLLLPSPRPRLRLIGNPAVDPETYGRLKSRVDSLRDSCSISIEHGLSLDQLADAYHQARVFVIPSEHESFCMPLVESMACGVPALARSLPSLRETGGAGGRYLDDDDPHEWASALQRLLEDDAEHYRARRAAIRAAERFSWGRQAGELALQL